MAEDRISAPQSSTGLMRFYDVNASKIQIDPRMVVGFAVLLIVVELALSMFK